MLRQILALFEFRIKADPLRKANQAVDRYIDKTRRGAAATDRMSSSFGGLRGELTKLVGAYAGLQGVIGFGKLSDEYVRLQNRIKVVTNDQDEFNTAQEAMFRLARETRQPVRNVTEMFQRYSIATKSLGLEQADVIKLSKSLIQGTLLSGTSAESARGSIIQLAQGIGTNFEAAGQEIRSIQENAPLLAQVIAEAAGGTSDQLMKMAKDGKITSRLVVDSIIEAGKRFERQFAQQQKLLAQGWTRIRTVLLKAIGRFNEWSVAMGSLASGMIGIADAVERLMDSKWMNNIINLALMLSGFAAVNLLVMGFNALATSIGMVIAWGQGFALLLGGWLPMFKALTMAVGRFVVSWILLPLLIEDFIGMLRGNKSVIGKGLEELFGKNKALEIIDSITESLKSLIDMVELALSLLPGTTDLTGKEIAEMEERNDKLMGRAQRFLASTFFPDEIDPETGLDNRFIFGPPTAAGGVIDSATRGRNMQASLPPAVEVGIGSAQGITIIDERTLTVNATSSGAQVQQIERAVSGSMDRDRRAIAAQTQ